MLTFKNHIANGVPGWRVLAGTNVLGTVFDADVADVPGDRGLRWQGVAPDGTRFGATSRPKLADMLLAHAGARRITGHTAPAVEGTAP